MSSVNINDQLYQQAIAVAAAQGKSVDQFANEALRLALGNREYRRVERNGLPTVVVNGSASAIDPRKVRQLVEEDGF